MAQFIIVVLLFCSQMAGAAEHGIFLVVKGKVLIQSASGATTEAKLNSTIKVGETVITEADSRAKIVMSDQRNIINVAPSTKLKFEKYTNSKDDKNVKLKLLEGKVRSKVGEKYNNNSSKFEIRTATAVAGVRGTDFITSYDSLSKTTEVITFSGEVAFTSLAGADSEIPTGAAVVVGRGERSQAKEGSRASEPVKVPPKELNQVESESAVKEKDPNEKREMDAKPGEASQDSGAINTQPPTIDSSFSEIKTGPAATEISREKSKVIINIQQPAPAK